MCMGVLKKEGKIMRISAIRNYEPARAVSKMNKNRNHMSSLRTQDSEAKQDTVAFKANETAKGVGIGALIGLGAITILSGGAAAPLVCGIYAAASGVAGGMLGNAIESTNKDNKDNKDDKRS